MKCPQGKGGEGPRALPRIFFNFRGNGVFKMIIVFPITTYFQDHMKIIFCIYFLS